MTCVCNCNLLLVLIGLSLWAIICPHYVQGLALRPGIIDGAISISAVQVGLAYILLACVQYCAKVC